MGTGKSGAYQLLHLAKEIKAVLRLPFGIKRISRIVNMPTYYPELKRKRKINRWLDNIGWLVHDKFPNYYYTSYGLDVDDFHNSKDYIPQREFINRRNKGNQSLKMTISGDYNYIVLLRDKYVFANYISSTIGKQYAIKSVGIIDKGRLYLTDERKWTKLEALDSLEGHWTFKIIDGECGEGVLMVSINNGLYYASGIEYSREDFIHTILQNGRWLIQPVIEQHDALKAFGTKSVNTIRAVTIQGKSGAIGTFNAFLRISADAVSFVDNRAMGGFGVGIDLDTGKLMRYGYQHDAFGTRAESHPLSGVVFDGYQLPYWEETVELICNAHKQFYELQSIGWDVVITPTGPVLLEGNDDWEIGGPQDTYGGLKQKWNELVNA